MISLAAADLVIRGALRCEGLQEVGGANSGLAVERILKGVGLKKGDPWCAAWVYDIGHGMLGKDWPLPATGSCDVLLEHAKKRGYVTDKPKAGDVFLLLKTPTDAIHTGFVTRVTQTGSVETIEGNSNPAGGREGYGVFKREGVKARNNVPDKITFIRWDQ